MTVSRKTGKMAFTDEVIVTGLRHDLLTKFNANPGMYDEFAYLEYKRPSKRA
jgi:hypothetical protein